jgi:hypothetical protein
MTEKDQITRFGMVIPEKYRNFVLGQNPLWSLEHFQAALAIAESVQYNPDILDRDFEVQ